jgi:hypothetical protein
MTTTESMFVQNANKEAEIYDFLHYHPQKTFQLKNVLGFPIKKPHYPHNAPLATILYLENP